MELFPVVDVGDGDGLVVLGVHDAPVGWRADLVGSISRVLVQVAVTAPSDALVGHVVVDGVGIAALVQQARGDEAVVEHGVCDQTARVVGLASVSVDAKGVAVASIDGIVVAEVALELVGIERLDIAAMVLVEVCELVVEEDGRGQVVRDPEAQLANGSLDVDGAIVVRHGVVVGAPLGDLRGRC